jgi:hypothetical protein
MEFEWVIIFGKRQCLLFPGLSRAFVWKYLKKITNTAVNKESANSKSNPDSQKGKQERQALNRGVLVGSPLISHSMRNTRDTCEPYIILLTTGGQR